ncbi:glycosyltransferase family 4 protein [Falsiroseomonas selenitidurans]|uniref:Glycosyltransferase family 4 protein n=1 Tax=Falsiroseomonas selenitidurans TaxID=2716335 RepID=A0ABX1E5G1_9PROT|nr:glycosyltransferase family 4 protein [Falsiroseomonas selenitidurans]NKC32416.1 glycosyltransferase family 4 protein [Falsiroseomonas selenitidurans]
MKILQVTNIDFALLHFISPLMRALRARGHEVQGACAEGPLLAGPRAEGFRIHPIPFARSLNPLPQARALAALVALMRAEKPDLVHAHMPISGLLARSAARIAGVPRIAYTGHGFLFNQPGPWWRRRLALGLERAAGRITHTYLTVSAEEAGDARRLGIHPHPVAVLNGRDPARFHPDPAARARLRAALGAAAGDCVVIAISRLVRHKGFVELLEAMACTPPNCVLWVAGERLASDHGEDLTPHFQRAAALLGRRLVMLGYRTDVPALLAAADVFTLPSHFEGLPMSIIEAMLTGLPVVATDIRGPREQVVPGETGLLVPPMQGPPLAAALSRLATDPALRQAMGAAGLARALAHFDEARVLGNTVALLEAGAPSP